jgi:hypothetical protein
LRRSRCLPAPRTENRWPLAWPLVACFWSELLMQLAPRHYLYRPDRLKIDRGGRRFRVLPRLIPAGHIERLHCMSEFCRPLMGRSFLRTPTGGTSRPAAGQAT